MDHRPSHDRADDLGHAPDQSPRRMSAVTTEPAPLPGHERWLRHEGDTVPAWLRPHAGDQRWQALAAVVVAIVFQLVLPDGFVLQPRLLSPILEALLCVALVVANPGRMAKKLMPLRVLSLALSGLLALANAVSVVLLVRIIITGRHADATSILAAGAAIWLTNVIAFALFYWEYDRGGPVDRALTPDPSPDFLFAQMTDDRLDPHWRATFVDYFYLSFTNSTAFSPTDTLPLSRWAKMLMLVQSAVALVTVALVAARAVNVLPQH